MKLNRTEDTMKLSFSIPSSKSSSKPNSIKSSHNFDEQQHPSTTTTSAKHVITEFDPSKPPTLPTPKTVIPPVQNQWQPLKKMKNLHLPLSDPNNSHSLSFEPDTTSSAVDPGSDMAFGLHLRRTSSDKNQQSDDNDDAELQRRRVPLEATMLHKLKDDLQRLPEDQGFDEFKDVPVEGFGAALLAGYGWSEGMGIGKNAKEDVKVIEYKRRTSKEGLGFVGDAPAGIHGNKEKKKEEKKGGTMESETRKKEKIVRIVGGRDAGLKASVVTRIGDDFLMLRLSKSGAQVKVKIDHVAELGSVEEERCLRKLKDLKMQRCNKEKGKRGRDEVEEKRVKSGSSGREEEQGKKQVVSWLTSHIRVRVISRDFKRGRLYLKKGEILDVVGPTTCDISMDESREIVQGVSQDILETVIPRRGGPVLVLYGKHKGTYGSLVERDLDRGIAIVRDAVTHELLNVKLEQFAEYIGDPSLLGH